MPYEGDEFESIKEELDEPAQESEENVAMVSDGFSYIEETTPEAIAAVEDDEHIVIMRTTRTINMNCGCTKDVDFGVPMLRQLVEDPDFDHTAEFLKRVEDNARIVQSQSCPDHWPKD